MILETISGDLGMSNYNDSITFHGLLEIFIWIMGMLLGGFGNIMLITGNGVLEVKFLILNNVSLIVFGISVGMLVTLLVLNLDSGSGWTVYSSLSTQNDGLDMIGISGLILSLFINGLSTIVTSYNMSLSSVFVLSLFSWSYTRPYYWSMLMVSVMMILYIPVLGGVLNMLLLDIHGSGNIFNDWLGGNSILYIVLFWIFGHPEVYVLVFPGFGILGFNVGGNMGMILSICSITVLGSIVLGHHMYTNGMNVFWGGYYSMVSVIVGVPTGLKVYSWILVSN